MASFIFGKTEEKSFADRLSARTSSFRKEREEYMDILVPKAFEELKGDLLSKASKSIDSDVELDITKYHGDSTKTPMVESEKLTFSKRLAKLFTDEGLEVTQLTSGKRPWCGLGFKWIVQEDNQD